MLRYIKVPILCGDDTCPNYYKDGFAICHFLKMGKKEYKCLAFKERIYAIDGRIMRCRKCMQAEKRRKEKICFN